MTTPDTLDDLRRPDQVRVFTLATFAAALGITTAKARGWADRGQIHVVRVRPGADRHVPITEIERLARDGWPVDVEALLDGE